MIFKFYLGGEMTAVAHHKIQWIEENFEQGTYDIYDEGWMYSEIYVRFYDEKYATLYKLRWQ